MAKGFGIAALILMLISFPIPVVGTWIGYVALAVAALAALMGSSALVIATTVIGIIKMYLLSPGLMVTMYLPFSDSSAPFGAYLPIIITTFFAVLPILCLVFRSRIRGLLGDAGVDLPTDQGANS